MKTLTESREIINQIDPEIRKLFLERMKIVKDVALYKLENNLPVFDETREKELIERLSKEVEEELKPYYLEFLNAMLKISKDYQKEIIRK